MPILPRSSAALALGCLLASVGAAQSLRLHPQLAGDRDVRLFDVSPDGEWVVYQANAHPDGRLELFSVPLRGSKHPRWLGPMTYHFEISANSRLVVYRDTQGIASMSLDGHGEPRRLTGPATSGPWITPDSELVVFLSSAGLFRVPIDGHEPPTLVHARSPWAPHPASVAITPDGRRVVYITEGSINHQASGGHVYSALLDGSASPVQLNSTATQASIGSYRFTPDSRWLIFRRGTAQTRSLALLSVPLDGSAAPLTLTPPLPAGANLYSFIEGWGPHVTPDSTRVVFSVDQAAADDYELFSAPVDGSTPAVKISTPPLEPPQGYPKHSELSPDGQQVMYGIGDGPYTYELYVVPVLGGVPARRVNGLLPPGDSVYRSAFSPDGSHVAYSAGIAAPGRLELYLVAVDDNTSARRLSDPSLTAGNVSEFEFTSDGRTLVYSTFRRENDQNLYELFAVSTVDPPEPRRLDGPLVAGGSVRHDQTALGNPLFRQALGDTRVVYLADLAKDELVELFTSVLWPDGSKVRR